MLESCILCLKHQNKTKQTNKPKTPPPPKKNKNKTKKKKKKKKKTKTKNGSNLVAGLVSVELFSEFPLYTTRPCPWMKNWKIDPRKNSCFFVLFCFVLSVYIFQNILVYLLKLCLWGEGHLAILWKMKIPCNYGEKINIQNCENPEMTSDKFPPLPKWANGKLLFSLQIFRRKQTSEKKNTVFGLIGK